MERAERVCRFCKRPLTSATSAKRVNSVPVFSATKNKDLLVPGQENLVLTDAFQNLGYELLHSLSPVSLFFSPYPY